MTLWYATLVYWYTTIILKGTIKWLAQEFMLVSSNWLIGYNDVYTEMHTYYQ